MVKPNEVTNSNVNPAMLPSGSKILKHGHPPRLSNSSTPKQINQPTAAAKKSPLSVSFPRFDANSVLPPL
ncbi:hypothetical protein Tco_0440251, partial [Tanacetum coccineum]